MSRAIFLLSVFYLFSSTLYGIGWMINGEDLVRREAIIKNQALSEYLSKQFIPVVEHNMPKCKAIGMDIKKQNDSVYVIEITFHSIGRMAKYNVQYVSVYDDIAVFLNIDGKADFIEPKGHRKIHVNYVDDEWSCLTFSLNDKELKLTDIFISTKCLDSVPNWKFKPKDKEESGYPFKSKPKF